MSGARGRDAVRIVGIVYLVCVLAMATIGVIAPAAARHAARLGTSAAAIGLAIGLFSVPAALLATIGGALADRIGARAMLLAGVAMLVAGDAIAADAATIVGFDAGLLVAGLGYAGIAVAAPALLIGALAEGARVRGIAFWSTYAPCGFAAGLLIAALLAGAQWRLALPVHAALSAGAGIVAAIGLPAPARTTAAARGSNGGRFAAWRDLRVLRLGGAIALPNAISYGTALVTPGYLAATHQLSIAASASMVAIAKLAAVLGGGIVAGQLLARRGAGARLFAGVAAIGAAAQLLLYLPASGVAGALAALIAWLFAFGAMSAIAMATLPALVDDAARAGASAGAVNQCIALASFAAPTIWFGIGAWGGYVALAWGGLMAAALLLPRVRDDRIADRG